MEFDHRRFSHAILYPKDVSISLDDYCYGHDTVFPIYMEFDHHRFSHAILYPKDVSISLDEYYHSRDN
jgi:hypothetical protein